MSRWQLLLGVERSYHVLRKTAQMMLSKYLLIVFPDQSNSTHTVLFFVLWPTIWRKIANCKLLLYILSKITHAVILALLSMRFICCFLVRSQNIEGSTHLEVLVICISSMMNATMMIIVVNATTRGLARSPSAQLSIFTILGHVIQFHYNVHNPFTYLVKQKQKIQKTKIIS